MPQLPDRLSYDELGGTKQDYSPVVDTSTDRSAEEVNKAFCAIAQMSRTAPIFIARVRFSNSGPIIESWESVWKGAQTTEPVIAKSSTGVYDITLPPDVMDEQGNHHDLVIRQSFISSEDIQVFGFYKSETHDSNILRVTFYAQDTNLNDGTGNIISLTIY